MNLKQLAEHLGLSQTTVSRALNGYPEVREATRLRVQEAARLAARGVPTLARQRFRGALSHIGAESGAAQTRTGPSAPRIRSQRLF